MADKKIGILFGMENTFPPALVEKINGMKADGVTAEFVVFPRENHNLTRTGEPKHLVESLNWQLYWFDRFLNGNEKAVPPDG